MNTKPAAPDTRFYSPSQDGPASGPPKAEEPIRWYIHHAAAAPDRETLKAVRSEARASYMRQFGERCKIARGSREVNDVALAVGVHRNTIWNMERGESLPDAFELEVLAREYGTTVLYLLDGAQGRKARSADAVAPSLEARESEGFVFVPLFDIHVSAGNGAFNDLEAVVAMRPFDVNYIRHDLAIAHNQIAMTSVVGRSMEPWLRPKDTVLIDLKDREAQTEGVHIVRLDGALLVKNLQRLPGKVLRVSSYNQDYEPFDIQASEDRDRDFEVIGRVRWAGVTFS